MIKIERLQTWFRNHNIFGTIESDFLGW